MSPIDGVTLSAKIEVDDEAHPLGDKAGAIDAMCDGQLPEGVSEEYRERHAEAMWERKHPDNDISPTTDPR